MNQVYATKLRMTQAFAEGRRIPLTVLKVEPHIVLGTRSAEKDGYQSNIIGIGAKKNANSPLKGFLKKAEIETTPRVIREIKGDENLEPKTVIDVSSILVPGSTINVSAISKGKGFAGVMKRHGFHGGPRTHGQSDRGRAPGSIARGTTPGRVVKGKRMAGRMGSDMVTVENLKIHSFNPETGILEVTGAISGAKGALAKITVTKKSSN